jgi:hypothetical protein
MVSIAHRRCLSCILNLPIKVLAHSASSAPTTLQLVRFSSSVLPALFHLRLSAKPRVRAGIAAHSYSGPAAGPNVVSLPCPSRNSFRKPGSRRRVCNPQQPPQAESFPCFVTDLGQSLLLNNHLAQVSTHARLLHLRFLRATPEPT